MACAELEFAVRSLGFPVDYEEVQERPVEVLKVRDPEAREEDRGLLRRLGFGVGFGAFGVGPWC